MPPLASNPDLRPFDLETRMRVATKVGNLFSTFGHARPLGFRISRYVRDGRTDRQTDDRTDKSNAYCPLPYVRGHNNEPVGVIKLLMIDGDAAGDNWNTWFVISRVGAVERSQTVTARRRRCVDDPRLRVAVADADVAARLLRCINVQPHRPAVRE